MFQRMGCDCIVWRVNETTIRMVESCRGDENLGIGSEEPISPAIDPRNIETARPLTPEELVRVLDNLGTLAQAGHAAMDLKYSLLRLQNLKTEKAG